MAGGGGLLSDGEGGCSTPWGLWFYKTDLQNECLTSRYTFITVDFDLSVTAFIWYNGLHLFIKFLPNDVTRTQWKGSPLILETSLYLFNQ